MQGFGYMWGDFTPEIHPVVRVRLTGFDGRQREITGRRDVAWREFFRGDGGEGSCGAQPCGFAEWAPVQPTIFDIRKGMFICA